MHARIRFNDVIASYQEQREEIDAAIRGVLDRGDFINGSEVHLFESDFAAACGLPHAVGTSSGTSALHLALLAAGIGPGDEVITSPMTFIATSEAISQTGARPVFADIDGESLNLSADCAAQAITPRTRAILFVHLHGNPTGIHAIHALAEKHGLLLIEDCAQAHGARVPPDDQEAETLAHVGSFGVAGCFSFFPAKNLGAFGDAGALVTRDPDLASRVRQLANHGREEKYRHLVEGYNYRLDTLQAAVLRVKLKRLGDQIQRRSALADRYRSLLSGSAVVHQRQDPRVVHALHLFAVQTEDRDGLQRHLGASNIETGVHYPIPLHLQPAYANLGYWVGDFPEAERVARRSLSLPLYPQLPLESVEAVCAAILQYRTGTPLE